MSVGVIDRVVCGQSCVCAGGGEQLGRCCSTRGVSIALLLPGRRQHVGRVAARVSGGGVLQPDWSLRRHTLPGGVCMLCHFFGWTVVAAMRMSIHVRVVILRMFLHGFFMFGTSGHFVCDLAVRFALSLQ
jgi:hypothetical protein